MGFHRACNVFGVVLLVACSTLRSTVGNQWTDTAGGFTCSCISGFELADDGNSCRPKESEPCTSGSCQNGGTCLVGVGGTPAMCVCLEGYTGNSCQLDINECTSFNGGCEDRCVNQPGTFVCECDGNQTLASDGKTCTDADDNIFRRLNLPRQLLPRGCATLFLTRCRDGRTIEVYLSSTSLWYRLNADRDITFTLGIVFVEVNSLSLPISLNGAEVTQSQNDFTVSLGTNGRTPSDGQPLPVTRTEDCITFNFTPNDLIQFISSFSFLNSFFDNLVAALPPWLGFSATPFSALDVDDLRTDLVYGSDMDEVTWCTGAPVLPSHLYSVFRFSSAFALSLYGNQINIPKPFGGRKFCLIVDVCHNLGGSVFLMVPEESRDLLKEFDVFKKLEAEQGVSIQPRGIGLSVVKGVNVRYIDYQGSALQLWNGDALFDYTLFNRADLWIGGDVTKVSKIFNIEGSADVFVSVPSPIRMLTALFIDEWNVLARIRATATPTLTFKLFNKVHTISFEDMVTAAVDLRMSIGGIEDRQWCGQTANPPGVFLTTQVNVNPFQTIPILKDWVFNVETKLYVFITSEPTVDITSTQIDILNDVIQIHNIMQNFKDFVESNILQFQTIISDTLNTIIDQMDEAINSFQDSVQQVITEIQNGNLLSVIDLLSPLWNDFTTLESTVRDFLDTIEHLVDATKDQFINFIKNELAIIKSNLDKAISKVKDQITEVVEDYSGFGLKFKTTLNIFNLKIIGVDLELVYSVDSLFQCSKFDKVKMLLADEKAVRFLGTLSKGIKLGYFLKLDVGVGIGGALSVDTDKLIIQLRSFVNMIGIKIEVDVFISKSGIFIYLEGNVWDLFRAQIEVTAELGNNWYGLTYNLKGTFGVAGGNSFEGSFLDNLSKAIQNIATETQKKLTQAQTALSKAQQGLTSAQNWLDDKKEDVQKANVHFDNAIDALEKAKDKLEAAKGPFQNALDKLNAAQKKVDNICKLKDCPKICVPGLSCKTCHKRVWGVKVPYPCCKFVPCKHKITNVLCEAGNLACKALRALAYGALEVAKLGVKVPLLALDIAKKAVSVAQVIVDKARIVLDVAEAVLDVAKIGLQAAKVVLEGAKKGLELVKIVVGIGAKILDQVIKFGLKNIIDVRKCGFEVELSTKNLPVFGVFCEVNAFNLGWKKIEIVVNFKKILQSLWQAAKATIGAFKDILKNVISGRKKRDIDFDSSLRLHKLLRKVRQIESNDTGEVIDTINVMDSTFGFTEDDLSDDGNRVESYRLKCKLYRDASSYIKQVFGLLHELVSYTRYEMVALKDVDTSVYTVDQLERGGLKSAEIDTAYLMNTYGLTMAQIELSLHESKSNLKDDVLINDLLNFATFDSKATRSQIESFTVDQLALWEEAALNGTAELYDESQCVDFFDCVFFSISTLYELHEFEEYENIDESKQIIQSVEDAILEIMDNTTTLTNMELFSLSESILTGLERLGSIIPFCKSSPVFVEEPQNVTAPKGSTVSFWCKATSPDTSLQYSWYMDGEMLENQSAQGLTVSNVSDDDEGYYECIVGNVVASITSRRAFLTVTEQVQGCVNSCRGHPTGDYQSCRGCHVYITCVNDVMYDNRPCPGNLVWDDNKKRCEYTSDTCGGR